MPLVTAAQLRNYLPQLTGTAEDSLLEVLSDAADALQAAWCGWPETTAGGGITTMSSATYVRYASVFYGNTRAVSLGMHWMASISQIRVDPDWNYGSTTDIPTAEARIDNDGGLIWLRTDSTHAWSADPLANKITFTHGFTDGSAPEAIIAATAHTVMWLLSKRRKPNVETESVGSGSKTLTDRGEMIPIATQKSLQRYIMWGSRVG